MSRVFKRLPAAFDTNKESEDENDENTVFADEKIEIFPCYNLLPKKCYRRSISENTISFDSIDIGSSCWNSRIRRKNARKRQNPFIEYKIPDEIIHEIFSSLRKKDLLSVMMVCKKFSTVGNRVKSWDITDVMDRPVSEESLISLMSRKIRVLRLAGAKANPEVQVCSFMFEKSMLNISRLEYLDLSRANLTQRHLMILLKPCRELQCLSVEGNILDDSVADCIASNRKLRELDISMTREITKEGALSIFQKCKRLEQLNASWCGANSEILHIIIRNLTSRMQKLNLSGSVRNQGLGDEHILALSRVAMNITDLDLSDNSEIGDSTITTIIQGFPRLGVLSINRCYGIDPNVMIHLNPKPSLVYINLHGCVNEENLKLFLRFCDRLEINRHYFNFTAKPVSYTSNSHQIWGHDMLEDY